MVASKHGHLDIVKYLAGEKGASVEVAAANGWTALMMEASGPAMRQTTNPHCPENWRGLILASKKKVKSNRERGRVDYFWLFACDRRFFRHSELEFNGFCWQGAPLASDMEAAARKLTRSDTGIEKESKKQKGKGKGGLFLIICLWLPIFQTQRNGVQRLLLARCSARKRHGSSHQKSDAVRYWHRKRKETQKGKGKGGLFFIYFWLFACDRRLLTEWFFQMGKPSNAEPVQLLSL